MSVHQERRKEPLILDTQFLKLNDCEAYMLLPENTPVTKIKLIAKKRPILSEALVTRKLLELSLSEKQVGSSKVNKTSSSEETLVISPTITKPIKTKKTVKQQLTIMEMDF